MYMFIYSELNILKLFLTCNNPLYLILIHLVKLSGHLFNFAALDLVEVQVDVIKKVIAEVFGHITGITCYYQGYASKFSLVFVNMKVLHSCDFCDESLVQDVAIVQNISEEIILREKCLKYFLLVQTDRDEGLFLCHLPHWRVYHHPEQGMREHDTIL